MNKKKFEIVLLVIGLLVIPGLFPMTSLAQDEGTISGAVYQSDGETPFTELIYIEVIPGDDSCGEWDTIGSALTNPADGTYSVTDLPPGTYYLRTSISDINYPDEWWAEPASMTDCSDAQLITVESGASVTGKDFQLETGAEVSGAVYQNDGETSFTEASIFIDVISGDPCNGNSIRWTDTNSEDGTYTIMGLAPGTYYLRTSISELNYINEWWAETASVTDCTAAESFTVKSGASVTGKNFQLNAGAAVSGAVYQGEDLSPFTGYSFYIDAVSGAPCGEWNTVRSAYTDSSDGTYTILGLGPGTYYLRTSFLGPDYTDEWWAPTTSVTDCGNAGSVTVEAGGTITGKDFHLASLSSVSGTVYQGEGSAPVTEEGILIQLVSGDPCGEQSTVRSGPVNADDGTYTVLDVPPGTYYIRTLTSDLNYLDEWWTQSESVSDCGNAESFSVGLGETLSGRDFQLARESGISGAVYQDDETPFTEDVSVQVVSGDPCGEWTPLSSVSADLSDGSYSIGKLTAGTYYLRVSASGSNYYDEWWAESASVRDCTEAKPLILKEGEVVSGKYFQLDPVLKGDINGDGRVDMIDALLVLRKLAGSDIQESHPAADVNGDGEIGLAELIYILGVLTPV